MTAACSAGFVTACISSVSRLQDCWFEDRTQDDWLEEAAEMPLWEDGIDTEVLIRRKFLLKPLPVSVAEAPVMEEALPGDDTDITQ